MAKKLKEKEENIELEKIEKWYKEKRADRLGAWLEDFAKDEKPRKEWGLGKEKSSKDDWL